METYEAQYKTKTMQKQLINVRKNLPILLEKTEFLIPNKNTVGGVRTHACIHRFELESNSLDRSDTTAHVNKKILQII